MHLGTEAQKHWEPVATAEIINRHLKAENQGLSLRYWEISKDTYKGIWLYLSWRTALNHVAGILQAWTPFKYCRIFSVHIEYKEPSSLEWWPKNSLDSNQKDTSICPPRVKDNVVSVSFWHESFWELGILNLKSKDFGATNGLPIPAPLELRICWKGMFLGAKLFRLKLSSIACSAKS